MFSFWLDQIFDLKIEAKDVLMEALQQPWQVQEKAMETDMRALQWVEDLEQRVVAADLHLKVRNPGALCQTNHITLTNSNSKVEHGVTLDSGIHSCTRAGTLELTDCMSFVSTRHFLRMQLMRLNPTQKQQWQNFR